MMSFAVLSQTQQQCGSSSSPKTPRSSWAVFPSRGDTPAPPAPPIKIRWFIWTMCPPCWWALTLQVCHQHLPSPRNRKPAKLPEICMWCWNLLVPFPSQSSLKPPGVCWREASCMHPITCGHMLQNYEKPSSWFQWKALFPYSGCKNRSEDTQTECFTCKLESICKWERLIDK